MGIGALADLLGGGGGGTALGVLNAVKRKIEVDGTELSEELDARVESVTVVDRLRMPDSFVIVLRDPGRSLLQETPFDIAGRVKISVSQPGGDSSETLFHGEVTSIEAEYDSLGSRAVVRGYDLLHQLTTGRKTRTFQNMTYSKIAKKVVEEAGLDVETDDSGTTFDHVLQANQSDFDFLMQLARRIDFDLTIDEDTVHFKKAAPAAEAPGPGDLESTDPTQLVWGHNLYEFRARVSAVAQVEEVKVRGWNVKDKEPIIGKAKAKTASAKLDLTPEMLAESVGGGTMVVVDRPVADQKEADKLAEVVAEQVASAAYEATAVAVGSPKLKAGQAVTVSRVDKALGGDWVITTARHEFGAGPYLTHMEFTGRQDRSIHGLVSGGNGTDGGRHRMYGVVIGIVTDNKDPDELGRVKVKYPWLADDAESHWARLAMPGAGKERGQVWLPEIGDEVLVVFEHGDVAYPIVIGGLWNGQDKPHPQMMGGLIDSRTDTVKRRALISRKGHTLIFYDDDENDGIGLFTADAKLRIYLDGVKGKLWLDSDGDIAIEAGGNLELTAKGKTTIKGATVALNPPG